MSRSSGSTSILIVLLIIFTFPVWIGLAGGLIGLFFGLIAGFFGILGGILGAVFGAIGGMFKAIFHSLFGWGWNGHSPFFFMNKFILIAIIIALVLVLRKKANSRSN